MEISAQEFVRRVKASIEKHQSRFTFFLGAGCSISSEIPGAGALVETWVPELKQVETGNRENVDDWTKQRFQKYDRDNPAAIYPDVMEALFPDAENRQREIETIVDGKEPGFGYGVLAQLITQAGDGHACNTVLTTNFDDLVADALYLYTNRRPLVVSHESLVGFARITRPRPLVIKLHGDARLAPKNTKVETNALVRAVKEKIGSLLSETGLIFIGYGGNDESIAAILKGLPLEALPGGIYWVGTSIPNTNTGTWLRNRNAIWVNHFDFDELMLFVRNEFGLPHPESKRFDDLLNNYFRKFTQLEHQVAGKPKGEERRALLNAMDRAAKEFDSWWAVEVDAKKYKRTDPEKAQEIYQDGLEKFSVNPYFLGNFANFMFDVRKDYKAAERLYLRAIKIDPAHAINLGNFAKFMVDVRKDYNAAEKLYRRAIKAGPTSAIRLGNFANFMFDARKDYTAAENLYRRAIKADPANANQLGNFSGFLFASGKLGEAREVLRASFVAGPERSDLKVELWFYRYAHIQNTRDEALAELKKLILEGARSPGWNLSANVDRALNDGHPEPKLLKALARVISESADPAKLERFAAWRKTG